MDVVLALAKRVCEKALRQQHTDKKVREPVDLDFELPKGHTVRRPRGRAQVA